MLQLYRRHIKKCRFWTGKSTNGNRRNNNCRCPVWVNGYLAGVRVNKTLDLRDWTRASELVRDWEIAGSVKEETRVGMPVREAYEPFLGRCRGAAAFGVESQKVQGSARQYPKADVTRAWRNDPIAQVEMLKGDLVAADGAPLRMAATRPRHEKGELAN